ncbi:uncharacterized protein si:ch1073-220m6.1 [Megalobrama amblycephala]|uniref:uncharacterized protein si:ch1073-220m6.1 n=1 Tax=Megalobrama amblycephala TaxID=75352 RepID=UPI002013FBBC|nr:uncharacterized protein si:ch1073-220m6.1 [Megalobrama amblycephala]
MKLILLCIFGFSLDFAAKCQENLYGLNGKSIHLSISLKNQSKVVWRRFNRKELLANSDGVPPDYEKRMKLNLSDWSLTIHNLEVNDSGLYEALTNWERDTVAAFALTVENTVSEPVIEVIPHDVNSSAGVCRATVNCSVDGSWATYDCDLSRCEKKTNSSINITVTVLDSRGFQCHANNNVSKNHSRAVSIMCREKQQSDLPPPPHLISWIAVTVGTSVALGLFIGLIVVIVKKRESSKVYPQSSHAVTGRSINTVIEQHETIYSTVQKPDAFQNPPGNNTDSNTEGTVYDIPTRHHKACQIHSVVVENEEQQRSGHDRTVKVKATVHQAAEPESEQMNTVYCKLGEI